MRKLSTYFPKTSEFFKNLSPRTKKGLKITLKILASIAGIWLGLLIILQIVLTPAVMTRIVNSVAADYIDADMNFGKVRLSMFRHFPHACLTLEDVTLTYPADRFEILDSTSAENALLLRGCGRDGVDTLASFSRFSASLNLASLVVGKINVPYLELSHPRIFAKNMSDSTANWNIFGSSSDEEVVTQDVDSTGVEKSSYFDFSSIHVGRMRLDGAPYIVYCSRPDSIYADVRLEALNVENRKGKYDVDLRAYAKASLWSLGEVDVPLRLASTVDFPKDSLLAVSVRGIDGEIGGIPFGGGVDLRYGTDSLWIKGNLAVEGCRVSEVLARYGNIAGDFVKDFQTDAVLTLQTKAEGWYMFDFSRIPSIDISIMVPDASLCNKAYHLDSRAGIDARISGGDDLPVGVDITDLHLKGKALDLAMRASAGDILGDDPLFNVDSDLALSLDVLRQYLDPESGIYLSGTLEAGAKGVIHASQMDMYKVGNANISCYLRSSLLNLHSAKDTIGLHLEGMDLRLAAAGNKRDSSMARGARVLEVGARLDSVNVNYKNQLRLRGKSLSLEAQNDASILKEGNADYYPFCGDLNLELLSLVDFASNRVALFNSTNTFKISPSKNNKDVPTLSFVSKNGGLMAKIASERVFVKDLNLNAKATKAVSTLAKSSPSKFALNGGSRPSSMRGKGRRMETPDWMSESDFKAGDFDFSLDQTLMDYYKTWNFDGSMSLARASLITPNFPLRTAVTGFSGRVSNNEVRLDKFSLQSGQSSFAADGRISNIRGALLRNSAVNLQLNMRSDCLNLNELLNAMQAGQENLAQSSTLSDEEEENEANFAPAVEVPDTLNAYAAISSQLLVVPANVNATVSVDARNVSYSTLDMETLSGKIVMKERCVQMKELSAVTNVGKVDFDGFYYTRTKKDIRTAFDLKLSDIAADKVIEMMPAVEQMMPLLKSFHGNLDCELAATANMDTTMSIILPTLKGIARIGGKDLAMVESEDLFKIAKLLMFRNIHNIKIDDLTAECVIADGQVEVFPFIFTVDRYSMALCGLQNANQSFNYHVSMLKSPLLIRFGVNFWGDDFDDFHFKLGRAKFKGKKRVPSFAPEVEQVRLALCDDIANVFGKGGGLRLGGFNQSAIRAKKEELGYQNAATSPIEELSADETKQLEEGVEAPEASEDDEADQED